MTIRSAEVDRDHPVTSLLGDLPATAVARIALAPLSPTAVRSLAGESHDAASLYAITAGNPFFVSELLADGKSADGHLPDSIRDAVWARLSRLPPAVRAFLDAVSILPGGAQPFMMPALSGEDSSAMADQCVERGLLRRDEKGALVFRHELARQATQERLLPAARRALHERVETFLAKLPDADSGPNILAQRLHHASLSGNVARVFELAPRAASQASMVGAHRQAAAHLTAALDHVALAAPPLAAQIYEDWAHETFLAASAAPEETIRAYTVAISLWRSQGQTEKVGLNLCRLARLQWRQGDTERAVATTEQAIDELEPLPAGKNLALAYSTRSQFLMLQDRFGEAIVWGERAMELSDRLGEIEIRVYALNNVGTSKMLSGQSGGPDLLRESLGLSLKHGFHDHASRAYTNLSECCMLFRDFPAAERLMTEGTSHCVEYDLDADAHYLLGRQAQLRLEQGRFHEARLIAEGVMSKTGIPRVMRLPALLVLGRVKTRLGDPGGLDLLGEALAQGLATSEPQRIVPARLALIEAAWLGERVKDAHEQAKALSHMEPEQMSPWDLGEMEALLQRLELPPILRKQQVELPPPRLAELQGDLAGAADLWLALDQPYEAALCLLREGAGAGGPRPLARAVEFSGTRPEPLHAHRRHRPKIAASAALVKAMIRLFCNASIRKVLESARPYHSVEKPTNSLALRPELKENSTTSAIGV